MCLEILSNFISSSYFVRAIYIIILLSAISPAALRGQEPTTNRSAEIYAAIELSAEGAKVAALQFSKNEEEPGLKLIYSDLVKFSLARSVDGEFAPKAAVEGASAVQKLLTRLRQEYNVPDEHIYLLGTSELGADHPQDLISIVNKTTGKSLTFLDAVTEVQLSIVGTIPQRERAGSSWIDNRNTSVLIDLGNYSISGGYQLLKYSPSPQYDFTTMTIPHGALSVSNQLTRNGGLNGGWITLLQEAKALCAGAFRDALRKERDGKPGLFNRKRVYLTGSTAWALATLLYPDKRENFIPLKSEDIEIFSEKVARSPWNLLNPSLSYMRDRGLRREAESELKSVRESFTPQQLVAAAELLKIMSDELNWREKKVYFARMGNFGSILSYIRLQAGK
ncbi:MAG: hypothetical protein L0220_17205 [Acidobacteria bacterium]|nr:hypothetical protein [Acidobacteriota bacterium]